jgi:hypothetical protein
MTESGAPTPGSLRPPTPGSLRRPVSASAPTPEISVPAAPASDSGRFGRIEEDGTVILLAPEGEVVVGQWAAGDPAEGLAFYARRYDDLVVEVDLVERRLGDGRAPAEQAEAVLTRVREALAARAFVGDVAALEARCDRLAADVDAAKVAARARKAEQREAALAARRVLVDEAESLSGSTSWKATTERYAAIVEEWKALPRADRTAEQELWQRISAARTAFDKRRRQHFTEVDGQRKEALGRKRDLIARAEALSVSTDWATTSRALRDLQADWKAAPRGSKTDEDKLWKRFKAAQDAFYAARTASDEAADAELRANVPAKLALVEQAEALLPVTDLKAAKSALRGIQSRWDAAGDLPKADREKLERRLKKVEETIRSGEEKAWQSSAPAAGNAAFTEALAKLEAKRDTALARGDEKTAASLDAQIASTRALLGG